MMLARLRAAASRFFDKFGGGCRDTTAAAAAGGGDDGDDEIELKCEETVGCRANAILVSANNVVTCTRSFAAQITERLHLLLAHSIDDVDGCKSEFNSKRNLQTMLRPIVQTAEQVMAVIKRDFIHYLAAAGAEAADDEEDEKEDEDGGGVRGRHEIAAKFLSLLLQTFQNINGLCRTHEYLSIDGLIVQMRLHPRWVKYFAQ